MLRWSSVSTPAIARIKSAQVTIPALHDQIANEFQLLTNSAPRNLTTVQETNLKIAGSLTGSTQPSQWSLGKIKEEQHKRKGKVTGGTVDP